MTLFAVALQLRRVAGTRYPPVGKVKIGMIEQSGSLRLEKHRHIAGPVRQFANWLFNSPRCLEAR